MYAVEAVEEEPAELCQNGELAHTEEFRREFDVQMQSSTFNFMTIRATKEVCSRFDLFLLA